MTSLYQGLRCPSPPSSKGPGDEVGIVIGIMCNVKFNMLWTSLIEERSTCDVVWEIMMAPCCKNEYFDIKQSRYRFLSLANITKERNFILDYLKVHLASDDSEQVLLKNNNILFMIKGVSVCKNAWLSTLGISVRREKRCSRKTCECHAWLNFLVNSIGDHQPDSALIHLPSCFTKLRDGPLFFLRGGWRILNKNSL